MSKYSCKDCGTGFATLPHRDCPGCGSGNIAIETDSSPERLSEAPDAEYANKMLRYLLEDLCEKVYNGPAAVEFKDTEIERTLDRMRPYLKEAPVKV